MIMYLRTDQVKYGLLKLTLLSSAFLFFFREMYLVRTSTSEFSSMIFQQGLFEKKKHVFIQ